MENGTCPEFSRRIWYLCGTQLYAHWWAWWGNQLTYRPYVENHYSKNKTKQNKKRACNKLFLNQKNSSDRGIELCIRDSVYPGQVIMPWGEWRIECLWVSWENYRRQILQLPWLLFLDYVVLLQYNDHEVFS